MTYPPSARRVSPLAPILRTCSATQAAGIPSASTSNARTTPAEFGQWSLELGRPWGQCLSSPIVPSVVLSRCGHRALISSRSAIRQPATRQPAIPGGGDAGGPASSDGGSAGGGG